MIGNFCDIVNSINTLDFKENDKKHRVRWKDLEESTGCKISFDGVPFQIVGVKILYCQNGPDKNKAKKMNEAFKKTQKNLSNNIVEYLFGKNVIKRCIVASWKDGQSTQQLDQRKNPFQYCIYIAFQLFQPVPWLKYFYVTKRRITGKHPHGFTCGKIVT